MLSSCSGWLAVFPVNLHLHGGKTKAHAGWYDYSTKGPPRDWVHVVEGEGTSSPWLNLYDDMANAYVDCPSRHWIYVAIGWVSSRDWSCMAVGRRLVLNDETSKQTDYIHVVEGEWIFFPCLSLCGDRTSARVDCPPTGWVHVLIGQIWSAKWYKKKPTIINNYGYP